MAISPTVEAKRWLYATLAADGMLAPVLGTRFYEVPAPDDAVDPFLTLWQFRAAEDIYTNGQSLVMTRVYLRTALAQRGTSVLSPFNLETLDRRITQILHAKSGTTATATILACTRLNPALLLPVFDVKTGVQYAQLGADWSLWVQ